jgi:hypothetical protein
MHFQDIQSLGFSAMVGAALVAGVLCTLAVAMILAAALTVQKHFARARASRLVVQARNLLTIGIYDRDSQDNPGPAELLGDAYRLQRKFRLEPEAIGLRDSVELDELINRAIRGNTPATKKLASETDTLPEFEVREFTADELNVEYVDEPTVPKLKIAPHVNEVSGVDDILKSCAEMTADSSTRINREDLN